MKKLACCFLLLATSALAGTLGDPSLSSIAIPSLNTNPTEMQSSSLRIAAREGRIKEVTQLLDRGVDVNGSGEFGETALMYAARFNFPQVAEALLEHGAEVNSRDSTDNTALIMAAKNCSVRIAAMLIAKGADANWVNVQGRSVLVEAAADGCAPIVDQLLRVRGIRLDQKDNQGSTALDYAAEEAQGEVGGPYSTIVTSLTRAGATHATFIVPPTAPSATSHRLN